MAKLFDIFQNLKWGLISTKTTEIDRKIDASLANIGKFSSTVDRNVYIDTLKNLVSKVNAGDLSVVVKDIRDAQAEFFDRSGRIQRYTEFDAVVRNISYCARALNVLTDIIISPDDISKRSINVTIDNKVQSQTTGDNESNRVKERLENIRNDIDIESYIDKIIRTTLKKGDYFIEIIYSPKGQNAFAIINESEQKKTTSQDIKDKRQKVLENSYSETDSMGDGDYGNEDNVKSINESEKIYFVSEQVINGNTETCLGYNVKYKMHNEDSDPVTLSKSGRIVLEYPLNTGYNPGQCATGTGFGMRSTFTNVPPSLIGNYAKGSSDAALSKQFKKAMDNDPDYAKSKDFDLEEPKNEGVDLKDIFITLHNPKYVIRLETERFKTCLGYLVFPKVDLASLQGRSYSLINSDIDSLCMEIIKQLKDKISGNQKLFINNKELRNVILNYLNTIQEGEDLKIRYVPPEYMTHFRINVDVHDPYGESIYECVLFDCKLLMALKTANTIKRLTSSTDKRLISVETGLPHNAKNLVDMLRENMKKRKISIDKFGSIDTIPSIISTFEDIYIPMRDGKKYVEIDSIKWGGDPSEDIEPLKFMRDNIVANLNVPPAYLGLEENATNRNLLTAESIVFARTIVSFQKEFGECLYDLFHKIYSMMYPKDIDDMNDVRINFSPPKTAIYEHEIEYLRNAADIINLLKDQGIPPEYLKNKYLSFLDWDEVEKYKTEEKIKNSLGTASAGDPGIDTGMGMSGGMSGMGMGGGGGEMSGLGGGGTVPGEGGF
jgi:hypothetical protein